MSIKWTTLAFFGIDLSGFSKKLSKSLSIQKIASAFSSIFACEGFKVKLCGDAVPSKIRSNLPLFPITFDIRECSGCIVVTTLISALTPVIKLIGIIDRIKYLKKILILFDLNIIYPLIIFLIC